MRLTRLEARWRDALLAAIVPAPGRGLPALAALDLAAFWSRFERAAPLHLQLGLGLPQLLAQPPNANSQGFDLVGGWGAGAAAAKESGESSGVGCTVVGRV